MSKLLIDSLSSSAGWSGVEPLEYKNPDFIAARGSGSLLFEFDGLPGSDKFAEKSITPVNISEYTELLLWCSSSKGIDFFEKPEDFTYKISFGFEDSESSGSESNSDSFSDSESSDDNSEFEYYLPARKNFFWVKIKIPTGAILNKIRITQLKEEVEDVLILSYLIATKDQLPTDIVLSIINEIRTLCPIEKQVGTVTATAGAKTIIIDNMTYLKEYSKFRIQDENNSEEHIVKSFFGSEIQLDSRLDGRTLLNSYTNAPVYMDIEIAIGKRLEIVIPAITVWYDSRTFTPIDNEESNLIDTYRVNNTVEVRKTGKNKNLVIQIDCEAEDEAIMDLMTEAVNRWIGFNELWVNGIKLDVAEISNPQVPAENPGVIPKNSFIIAIDYMEEVWTRITQSFLEVVTVNAEPVQEV